MSSFFLYGPDSIVIIKDLYKIIWLYFIIKIFEIVIWINMTFVDIIHAPGVILFMKKKPSPYGLFLFNFSALKKTKPFIKRTMQVIYHLFST